MSTGVMRSGSQLLWLQYKNTRRKKYKVTAICTANLEFFYLKGRMYIFTLFYLFQDDTPYFCISIQQNRVSSLSE